LFRVCLTVWENAGLPENFRIMMDYKKQGKKKEGNLLDEIYGLRNLYILSIRFKKILIVCEYQLRGASMLAPFLYSMSKNRHLTIYLSTTVCMSIIAPNRMVRLDSVLQLPIVARMRRSRQRL
jgi:hypothetical protein